MALSAALPIFPEKFSKLRDKQDPFMNELPAVFNNEQRQQFQVQVDAEIASLEYRLHEGVLVLMHTEVPEKMAGRGIATALAEYGMNYARIHHLPVKVYCPFVLTWLKRHPEQMDIVIKPKTES